jgi:hypothetical protein
VIAGAALAIDREDSEALAAAAALAELEAPRRAARR